MQGRTLCATGLSYKFFSQLYQNPLFDPGDIGLGDTENPGHLLLSQLLPSFQTVAHSHDLPVPGGEFGQCPAEDDLFRILLFHGAEDGGGQP